MGQTFGDVPQTGNFYTSSLSGSLAPSSAWGPTTTLAVLVGTITAAGSIVKQTPALFAGSITPAGAIAKQAEAW